MGAPEGAAPESAARTTVDVREPGLTAPASGAPGAGTPAAAPPKPAAVEPDTAEPDTAEPDSAASGTAGSDAATAARHHSNPAAGWRAVSFRTRIWVKRARIVGVRVARLVRMGATRLLPGIRYLLRSLHSKWRRSMQFRTVLMTLMLAIMSFAVVGAYLSNQIANNLFQERLVQAESETRYNVKQV